MIAKRFTELRAWETATAFKRAVYEICEREPLRSDFALCDQLRQSAASAPANIAEGFGRFNPGDFGRCAVIARASLLECQNHLLDAVHRGHINEQARAEANALAVAALQETTGLIEYLQSPEALRNARRIKERSLARREARKAQGTEPRTGRRTRNPEQGTRNDDQ